MPVGWRELSRPTPRHVVLGLGAACILYGGAVAVARAISIWPALTAQMRTLYGWKSMVPQPLAIPLLLVIVLGEEIVWRNAVTLPFAARFGPVRGAFAAAAAFSMAHASLGVPLLLAAALAAGAFWSALVVKTRSAIPALVSHAVWDLVLLFWLPLVAP